MVLSVILAFLSFFTLSLGHTVLSHRKQLNCDTLRSFNASKESGSISYYATTEVKVKVTHFPQMLLNTDW